MLVHLLLLIVGFFITFIDLFVVILLIIVALHLACALIIHIFFVIVLSFTILFVIAVHFVLLVDILLNLVVLSAFHHDLVPIHAFLHHHLSGSISILNDLTRSSFLHEGLATVLSREVGSCYVKAVVVIGGDQELALLICEVFIRIMASFTEQSHEVLQLFDLI